MCEVPATVDVYRVERSLVVADSHFFPNQKISWSRILGNNFATAQEYLGKNVRMSNKYFAENVREFAHNIISKSVCIFACKYSVQPEVWTWNLTYEEKKKNSTPLKTASRILPIATKRVEEEQIYHNLRHCVHCAKGKRGKAF